MYCIGIQFIMLFYIHRLLWIAISAMLWPYQSCSCRTVDSLSCCCALSERIKIDKIDRYSILRFMIGFIQFSRPYSRCWKRNAGLPTVRRWEFSTWPSRAEPADSTWRQPFDHTRKRRENDRRRPRRSKSTRHDDALCKWALFDTLTHPFGDTQSLRKHVSVASNREGTLSERPAALHVLNYPSEAPPPNRCPVNTPLRLVMGQYIAVSIRIAFPYRYFRYRDFRAIFFIIFQFSKFHNYEQATVIVEKLRVRGNASLN